jgi:hypothetical protein
MMSFEKRLARLEAARNMRLANRKTCVIFDGDIARVDAGSPALRASEATRRRVG